MATPSKKSPEVEVLLGRLGGRIGAIRADRCIDSPLGCGGPAISFRDERSRHEYTISGLCQGCQDDIFGAEEVR